MQENKHTHPGTNFRKKYLQNKGDTTNQKWRLWTESRRDLILEQTHLTAFTISPFVDRKELRNSPEGVCYLVTRVIVLRGKYDGAIQWFRFDGLHFIISGQDFIRCCRSTNSAEKVSNRQGCGGTGSGSGTVLSNISRAVLERLAAIVGGV